MRTRAADSRTAPRPAGLGQVQVPGTVLAMRAVYLEHPDSLRHETGGHPERAARITAIERELQARGWLGFERVRSPAVGREVLEAVHPRGYIEAIERFTAAGGGPLDADTLASRGSFDAALHSAGARCGWWRCCSTARRPPRSAPIDPPAITRFHVERWGSACSTTWPSRRRSRCAGADCDG